MLFESGCRPSSHSATRRSGEHGDDVLALRPRIQRAGRPPQFASLLPGPGQREPLIFRVQLGHPPGLVSDISSGPPPTSQIQFKGGECSSRSTSTVSSLRPMSLCQLRGDCRDAARGGALRHRGPDGDRSPWSSREVRARARRDVVPRRGVRLVAGGAGQAAARDPGSLRSSEWAGAAPVQVDTRMIVATNRPLSALVEHRPVPARSGTTGSMALTSRPPLGARR